MMTMSKQLLAQLEGQLIAAEEQGYPVQQLAEQNIRTITNTIRELKKSVSDQGFEDEQEQIDFFKHIAPAFYSQLVYYIDIFQMESRRPSGSMVAQRQLMREELRKTTELLVGNSELQQYIQSGATHLDAYYFTRKEQAEPYSMDAYSLLITDCPIVTPMSFKVARILAAERYAGHLEGELNLLKARALSAVEQSDTPSLRWTATDVLLTELIYLLYAGKVLNNGNCNIKQIADCLGYAFNSPILKRNIYKIWQEILDRKKSPTSGIEDLIRGLRRLIDDARHRPARL